MASSVVDTFFQQSPQKVYRNAHKFSKTLGRFTQLPSSLSKSKHVKLLAEQRKDDIRYVIDDAKYQNQLYRKLQKQDQMYRKTIDKKMSQKQTKIQMNIQQIRKKYEKDSEKINKHLGQVYKKYVQQEKSKKVQKDKQAIKLRKSLLQFYDKERKLKKQADEKQLSVSTCYQDAVSRLEKIHQKNEQYAHKTQRQHLKRMARNSGRDKNIMNLSRMKSAENKKKQDIYEQNCQIMKQKQYRYIQTYCKDLDTSLKAFQHKQKEEDKTKQRIHKFFKQKIQKWQVSKKRVDEQKSHIPDRCTSLINKAQNASFRQTISSFKQSGRNWLNRVQENKSMIYERDERAKDQIMQTHLDLRLRNTSSFRVDEKMSSMRNQAKKLTNDFV